MNKYCHCWCGMLFLHCLRLIHNFLILVVVFITVYFCTENWRIYIYVQSLIMKSILMFQCEFYFNVWILTSFLPPPCDLFIFVYKSNLFFDNFVYNYFQVHPLLSPSPSGQPILCPSSWWWAVNAKPMDTWNDEKELMLYALL